MVGEPIAYGRPRELLLTILANTLAVADGLECNRAFTVALEPPLNGGVSHGVLARTGVALDEPRTHASRWRFGRPLYAAAAARAIRSTWNERWWFVEQSGWWQRRWPPVSLRRELMCHVFCVVLWHGRWRRFNPHPTATRWHKLDAYRRRP